MSVSPNPAAEFKKSFENDSQSSDNINFLKVQWSSRQLPTVRRGRGPCRAGGGAAGRETPPTITPSPRPQLKPILSEIEYLQDQHLLLTVKSLDGYESYGECPRRRPGTALPSWGRGGAVPRGMRTPPTPPHPGCHPQGSASSP